MRQTVTIEQETPVWVAVERDIWPGVVIADHAAPCPACGGRVYAVRLLKGQGLVLDGATCGTRIAALQGLDPAATIVLHKVSYSWQRGDMVGAQQLIAAEVARLRGAPYDPSDYPVH